MCGHRMTSLLCSGACSIMTYPLKSEFQCPLTLCISAAKFEVGNGTYKDNLKLAGRIKD